MSGRLAALAVALPAVALLAGCESTQEKSAKLEAEGAGLAKVEKIKIGAANQAIEVTDKALLADQYGTALVVRVKNASPEGQVDVPIAVNVKNAKGKSIYKNDIEGLEHGLVKIPMVMGQEETWWVNDQVLVSEKAKSADVTIGKSEVPAPRDIPEIEVSEPTLEVDPVSGINVTGEVTNKSQIEQIDLLIYAVATKGGKVVAAGRGLIPKLKTDGKPEFYNVYFIGDPRGAEIEVFAPPSNFE
jgi:hypothetical protein